MYILAKQFSDKFNKLYTKSMHDDKIDNDDYNEIIEVYDEYKKSKKKKNLSFFKLKLLVFSYKNIFSNYNFSFIIYH